MVIKLFVWSLVFGVFNTAYRLGMALNLAQRGLKKYWISWSWSCRSNPVYNKKKRKLPLIEKQTTEQLTNKNVNSLTDQQVSAHHRGSPYKSTDFIFGLTTCTRAFRPPVQCLLAPKPLNGQHNMLYLCYTNEI